MARFIPLDTIGGFAIADIIAVVIVLLICYIAGIIAQNSSASGFIRETERRFLWKIPGYIFVKGVIDSFSNNEESVAMRPVLAKLDDASMIAFEIERSEDGRVVIYVPGAPNPWSGAIQIMNADRIEPLTATMMEVVELNKRLGRGTSHILKKTV
ncbi:MAG: DUF502 domain-containing protein [Desulfobacterales bacterium]|nr:DUF502 domain-containing protein [Desulfobacterales bacterium]MBF0397643.1 DUF502 domain-containing protein [Desulfobacterales bacterium]